MGGEGASGEIVAQATIAHGGPVADGGGVEDWDGPRHASARACINGEGLELDELLRGLEGVEDPGGGGGGDGDAVEGCIY